MEGDFDDENTILKDAAHSTRDKHGCNNKAEQLVFVIHKHSISRCHNVASLSVQVELPI
jgi:hypothetical protein